MNNYVVVIRSLVDGVIAVVGPFATREEAEAYGTQGGESENIETCTASLQAPLS